MYTVNVNLDIQVAHGITCCSSPCRVDTQRLLHLDDVVAGTPRTVNAVSCDHLPKVIALHEKFVDVLTLSLCRSRFCRSRLHFLQDNGCSPLYKHSVAMHVSSLYVLIVRGLQLQIRF